MTSSYNNLQELSESLQLASEVSLSECSDQQMNHRAIKVRLANGDILTEEEYLETQEVKNCENH